MTELEEEHGSLGLLEVVKAEGKSVMGCSIAVAGSMLAVVVSVGMVVGVTVAGVETGHTVIEQQVGRRAAEGKPGLEVELAWGWSGKEEPEGWPGGMFAEGESVYKVDKEMSGKHHLQVVEGETGHQKVSLRKTS